MIADIYAKYYYMSYLQNKPGGFAMLLKEEINKYLNYCKFQKELDDKTIKAYKADLEQFITVIGENNPDKEMLNAYLVYLHRMYKQKQSREKLPA